MSGDFKDDDYDDGSESSGRSRDRDMEPGDAGWLESEGDEFYKDLAKGSK